ncbi:aspartate aminotransferase [Paraphoma chrysanthemicola]|uniref:Aspartate aminotransferase n=1 Tax=Paraphoma chrysanthemicola TaxID=798071 RepID=A0A8K0R3C0_9PLEO|nr:aspartate aminotransferase [Paraphoma chrysanthemicola]
MSKSYLDLLATPADGAFGLIASFDVDPRPRKVSLIAGAYRDENGEPWILPSVQQAKARLSTTETHEYLGIAGSSTLTNQAKILTFGSNLASTLDKSIVSIQTVSGTGANHLLALFLTLNLRPNRVFIPNPTWINHHGIWAQTDTPRVEYPYYDAETRGVDMPGMLRVLETAEPNDIVILQACAHNPTGIDLSHTQWKQIAQLCKRKNICVLFDAAYQGFASGDVDADAWAIRHFVQTLILDPDVSVSYPGVCVAQSFSKNFGLYGERVGALHIVAPRGTDTEGAKSALMSLARVEYSNPPRYGAAIVSAILSSPSLFAQWKADLVTMSSRIKQMRTRLREELELENVIGEWGFIENQIGMFSYLGLGKKEVGRLREECGVYLLESGRASLCGLNEGNVGYVARAIGEIVGRRNKEEDVRL